MKVRKKIKISGIISSKAFLSHISTLAQKSNLSGWVKGDTGSINIEAEGNNISILEFLSNIQEAPQKNSRITEINLEDTPVLNTEEFYIIQKEEEFSFDKIAPQDIGICDDCLKKLFNLESKNFNYPFISCDKCGPRYSIINSLPYTRENSSLEKFKLCKSCNEDADKGIFETSFCNCKECGPKIWLKTQNKEIRNNKDIFENLEKILSKDGVVLLKSINCFYLCASAFSKSAVQKIRDIKVRKDKPLTVMVKNLEEAKKFAYISEIEEEFLKSEQKPVVELKLKRKDYLAYEVANGFDKIGVMLPFTPIHNLLFELSNQKVLIMSSANVSGRSIEVDNESAELTYKDLVDGILLHNMDILNGSDDSVITILNNKKYAIRLARGYAPNNIPLDTQECPVVLACGAHHNSTITLVTPDGKAHVSPYMGNLESYNVFDLYKKNVALFCKLFGVTPEYAVCDFDPDYLSTRYVKSLKIPYYQVQHHYAHLLSCLVDNNIPLDEPVIGVIFDGSGLGDDQTNWGGEFLVSTNLTYQRASSIPVFKMIGFKGKETQIYRLGYSLLQKTGIEHSSSAYKNLKLSAEEESIFSSLMNKGVLSPLTSSASKLFDALASILGVTRLSSYEEYSSLLLESIADKNNKDIYALKNFNIKNTDELIRFIANDIDENQPVSAISAKFHNTLAKMVATTCKEISNKTEIDKIALSGSVWMNILLLTRTIEELEKVNLKPLIHSCISTNDEGLSLGQAAYLTYVLSNSKTPEKQMI